MYRTLALLLAIFVLGTRVGAAEPATTSGRLRTEGLSYSAELAAIHLGDFGEVGLDQDDNVTAALVTAYRGAFSERCAAALPANKVQIMTQKCEREEWQENGYGEVAGSRHCASTVTVGTGKYADPEVNRLSDTLEAGQVRRAAGDIGTALRDPIGYMSPLVNAVRRANKDMNQLLVQNGCSSAVTKRFEANLIRFGSGRDAIVTQGTGKQVNEAIVPLFTGWAAGYALWCGEGCEGNAEPVMDMLKTPAQPQGPMVLQCEYMSQGDKRYMYFFWPKVPPATIKELRAADSSGRLRWMGSKGLQHCPETKEKALELQRAARVAAGYPTDEPSF